MNTRQIQSAIFQTIVYSSLFSAGIRKEDCFLWLHTEVPISQIQFDTALANLLETKKITQKKDYLGLSSSDVQNSLRHDVISKKKQLRFQKKLWLISWIPWIHAIGVTGSVAAGNAQTLDDIDLILLTQTDRLWLTRILVTPILVLFGVLRTRDQKHVKDLWCLNLWLDEESFFLRKHDVYTAREILQIKWIYDKKQTVNHFLSSNTWVHHVCANTTPATGRLKNSLLPQNNRFLSACNVLAFLLQKYHMKSVQTREEVKLHSAFFHPRDVRRQVIHTYRSRLSLKKKI